MVVDCSRAENCRRFFMLAEAWLGGIDAVVISPAGLGEAREYLCMQEAIQRMQAAGRGHLITIELPGEGGSASRSSASRGSASRSSQSRSGQRMVSALRRQAREAGIRVTQVEPEAGWQNEPGAAPGAGDIARCVLESLVQPFGTEVVLVPAF
jgi:NAD(P)-dependent dehydrogenase (short-subunit alcohol dehydrogenase family)